MKPNLAWWPVALSRELQRQPLGCTLQGVPLVIFRDAEGVPAVLPDRCPHRFAPLSAGRVRDGTAACDLFGYTGVQGEYIVALENTPTLQNVIVCTLCSCTAWPVLGLPPDWYKSFEYRARVVRESRTVLREMGLDLPLQVEIRVWDTTADTRFMVLPMQPPETIGWPEDKLAAIVTRDSLIGVARPSAEGG